MLSLGPKYKARFKNTSEVACNSLCNYQVVQMMKCCVSCNRLYIPAMWQVFLSIQQRKFIIYATGVKLILHFKEGAWRLLERLCFLKPPICHLYSPEGENLSTSKCLCKRARLLIFSLSISQHIFNLNYYLLP